MKTLEGRVGVVTGAASGIGKAIAKTLVAEGVKVVLADVEEGALKETADELGATGDVFAHVTDVADAASVQSLADATVAHYGAAHIVCNNAGVSGLVQQSWTAPHRRLAVGVRRQRVGHRQRHPLRSCRSCSSRTRRHVINTGSAACFEALPGMAAYGASKHAVLGISEALYREMQFDQRARRRVGARAGGHGEHQHHAQRAQLAGVARRRAGRRTRSDQPADPRRVHARVRAGQRPDGHRRAHPPTPSATTNSSSATTRQQCVEWSQHPAKLGAGENPSWPPT